MNTRLQVEHPVTEMITGIDLVEQQILVARGKKLGFKQDDLSIKGHAVELRVYAEDPKNNFLPSIGTLEKYQTPKGENVRVDDSFLEGMQIPIHYDPMIAKLITYAGTRKEAIAMMDSAISDYHIEGIETTLGFGQFVMNHKAFTTGKFDTHFVKKYYKPKAKTSKNKEVNLIAGVAALLFNQASEEITIPEALNESWFDSRK